MMDGLSVSSSSTMSSSHIGCISCTNKFYSAISIGGHDRCYAEVIFRKVGRMASLMDKHEGRRPSGARKVLAQLVGEESFVVDNKDISVAKEGYLGASKVQHRRSKDDDNVSTGNVSPVDNHDAT